MVIAGKEGDNAAVQIAMLDERPPGKWIVLAHIQHMTVPTEQPRIVASPINGPGQKPYLHGTGG